MHIGVGAVHCANVIKILDFGWHWRPRLWVSIWAWQQCTITQIIASWCFDVESKFRLDLWSLSIDIVRHVIKVLSGLQKTSLKRCHFPFKALSIWRSTVETTLSLLPYSDKDFSESRNQGIWDTVIRSHNHFTPDRSKIWSIYGKLVLFSCCQTENSCKSCSSEWRLKIYKYYENIAQSCNARTKSSTHLMFNWNGIREL